jgi:hypothetical protein
MRGARTNRGLSEATKTVGSWILTDENRARRVIQGRSRDGKPVSVCIIEDWVREEDAVLLAAARDLLAACEKAEQRIVDSAHLAEFESVRATLRAAIAKASGK